MSINAGSAVAYLELDYSQYTSGLMSARQQLDTFTDNTQEAGSRIQSLGGMMTGIGGAITKGLTVPLVGVGVTALTVAANFEQGMSNVQALTGATGYEFEALSEQAKQLGSTTMFSATQASEAMAELASAGFTTNEIMSAMPGLLDLAASGSVDLATAAGIASSTLRGFGLEANQTSHVSDVLAEAAARTNAGITDMGEAMKYIAPVASAMGISIEETAAAVGLLSNAGIQGGQSGTVLRGALSRLAKPSKEASDLMKELGFNAYDTNGKMLALNEIIGNLKKSTEKLTDEQKQNALVTMFGQESLSGMLALMQAGSNELNSLTKGFENCDGSAKKMADTMQNNLKGKVTAFKSALEGAGIAIGENLIPVMTNAVEGVTDMVSAFNNLDPAVQRNIVSIGATVAAIGPLMMVGGKVITGIGKTISLVNKTTSLTIGFGTALSTAVIPLVAVGAGVYAWHEAMDVANQKVTKSREEMSWMEKTIADLTGKVTYSKEELEEMGLVYKDFNENISSEFQESVKEMTLDIHDFGMELDSINVDNVMTDEEVTSLTSRVNGALESCNTAIDSWSNELQSGLSEAFSVDGAIDESESALLEYWNSRGNKEKEEAQNLYNEINTIIANARSEGRTLNQDEITAIQNYYAQIKQIELEAQANNNYELEYAQQEFRNRMSTLDAENAEKLLQERYQQSQEEQIEIRSKYDALIEIAKSGYESLSEEDKANVDATVARLEASKNSQLELSQSYYDEAYQYAVEHNENLKNRINKFNGEILEQQDAQYYQELVQATEHYQGLEQVTESGYQQMYNTATQTWDDVYVKIDETTGRLSGIYNLNTQNIGTMTKNDASALQDEIAAWQQTESGILANCLIIGDAYVDLEGNITNSSDKVIGKLIQVEDENGNLVDTIVDANNTPLKIGENTAEVIKKLKDTQQEVKNTDGKSARITVEYESNYIQKYNNQGPGYTKYATGTENAMPGIASVAEYGPELIVGAGGRITLASNRQYMNFEGGETVYNARQTKEILSSMDNINSEQKISKSDVIEAANLIVSSIKGLNFNIENAIKETGNTTVVGDLGGPIDIDRIDMRDLEEALGERLKLHYRWTGGYK